MARRLFVIRSLAPELTARRIRLFAFGSETGVGFTRAAVPLLLMLGALLQASAAFAGDDPVSFSRQVQPIFQQSCVACHKPEKKKGKLDLTTHAAVMAGGAEGKTVVAGKPGESSLIEQVIPHGKEPPAMPEKGEPLSAASVEVLRKWVEQGAKDDSDPAKAARPGYVTPGPAAPTEGSVYKAAPVISALAISPDGKMLAIAGRREVLLVSAEGEATVLARLPLASPRITGLTFAAKGKLIVAAGGAVGQYGQLVAWDVDSREVRANWSASGDTLFGLSVTDDGTRAAVGCADRTVRVINLADGKEVLNNAAHTDWVMAAAISGDGATLVTTGRDKAVKRIELGPASPTILDIAEPTQPGTCVARNPSGDLAVVGASDGATRLYRVADLKPRTEKEKDPNRVRECERLPGPVNAIVFSADGSRFAAAGGGEVKVFNRDGNRTATLVGHDGPVYAVAFTPDGNRVFTAGFDAKVRLFEAKDGKLVREFTPFAK